MQGTPCLLSWVWAIPGKLQTEGVWIYILFWTSSRSPTPQEFYRICQFTLSKQAFTTANSAKLCDTSSGFPPSFFSKISWLSRSSWDSSSWTFPDFSQKWITRFNNCFLSLNPRSLKEIQGENLHSFKEI